MILCFAFALLWAVGAGAYQEITVKNAGNIKGVIKFSGAVPADEELKIFKDAEFCGASIKAGKYIVGGATPGVNGGATPGVKSAAGVKNAVVWIDDIKSGRAVEKKTVDIAIKKCAIEPLVSVGFVGGNYSFVNEDTILHTLQLKLDVAYHKNVSGRNLPDGATILNLALPTSAGRATVSSIKRYHRYTNETGRINVLSNLHEWMRGYIFVLDHPYAAVTDEKGEFSLDGLPPGQYTLNVWHEGFGTRHAKITVESGRSVMAVVDFADDNRAGGGASGGAKVQSTAAPANSAPEKSAPENIAPEKSATQKSAPEKIVPEKIVPEKTATDVSSKTSSIKSPSIKFAATGFDFGSVTLGAVIKHDFEFVNRGDETLKLVDVVPA
jgi:hypothetical protein